MDITKIETEIRNEFPELAGKKIEWVWPPNENGGTFRVPKLGSYRAKWTEKRGIYSMSECGNPAPCGDDPTGPN